MCRLYGFRSTAPRKVECELIEAQNALVRQSERDRTGESNPDGWGLGFYRLHRARVERDPSPAFASEEFRRDAARVRSRAVVAHVRRATVGRVCLENTHPFDDGSWLLAHNGTIAGFEEVRPRLLSAMTAARRASIRGDTDSEHLFHYLESLAEREPQAPRIELLRAGLTTVREWASEAAPGHETALNVIWAGPDELLSSRLGRTLFAIERFEVHPCEVCGGELHAAPDERGYRAVAIASEPITTTEAWREIPDGSVLRVSAGAELALEPL